MLNADRASSLNKGPYKGLETFTEKDSEFLFGRNEERERLVYSLQSSRLSVLYGAKHVGKTSLLRAGLANALRWNDVDRSASDGLESSDSGAPESAVIVFDDWSNANVLHSLCTAIDRELERIGIAQQERPDFQSLSFVECCKRWTKCLGEKGGEGELFILLDQFGGYLRNAGTKAGSESFYVEFAKAVSTRGLPVNFLVAIRDDLLADLDRFRSTIPGLYNNLIRLEALTRAQAIQAIQAPLQQRSD